MEIKKKTGRPEILTPEIQKIICSALLAGGFLETSIVVGGISKSTFYKWMKRGEREKSGPYREFMDAIKKALATAEVKFLNVIGTASGSQWQAAAWILERRWPKKFARRYVPEGSHPTNVPTK